MPGSALRRSVAKSFVGASALLALGGGLALAAAGPATSGQWSPAIVASPPLSVGISHVLIEPDGSLVAGWDGFDPGSSNYVLQARRVSSAGTLGPIVDITQAPGADRSGLWQMASAADGSVRFVWTTSANGAYPLTVHTRRLGADGTLSAVQDVFLPKYEAHHTGSVTSTALVVHADGSALIAGLGGNSSGPLLELRQLSATDVMAAETDIALDGSASGLRAVDGPSDEVGLIWYQYDEPTGQPGVVGPGTGIRALSVAAGGNPSPVQTITTDGTDTALDLAVAQDGTATAVWAAQVPSSGGGLDHLVVRAAHVVLGGSLLSTVDVGSEGYYDTSGAANRLVPIVTVASSGDALVLWADDNSPNQPNTRIVHWSAGGAVSATQSVPATAGVYATARSPDGSIALAASVARSEPIQFLELLADGTQVVLPTRSPDSDVAPTDRTIQTIDDFATGPNGALALTWTGPAAGATDGSQTVRLSYLAAPPPAAGPPGATTPSPGAGSPQSGYGGGGTSTSATTAPGTPKHHAPDPCFAKYPGFDSQTVSAWDFEGILYGRDMSLYFLCEGNLSSTEQYDIASTACDLAAAGTGLFDGGTGTLVCVSASAAQGKKVDAATACGVVAAGIGQIELPQTKAAAFGAGVGCALGKPLGTWLSNSISASVQEDIVKRGKCLEIGTAPFTFNTQTVVRSATC